jgi:hypothetical protein
VTPQLWARTEHLSLLHDPARRVVLLVRRHGYLLLAEVRGHPCESEVFDLLAKKLAEEAASPVLQRDLELLRRAGAVWRPAA